jgi:hypothetical protein
VKMMSEYSIDVKACKDLGLARCPRCQKYHGVQCNYENLCDDCCSVLTRDHPTHWAIPGIKEAYTKQVQTKSWLPSSFNENK